MARVAGPRAGRVELPDSLATDTVTADYASAFGVTFHGGDRSAEDWARSMFEGAPRPLRWSVLLGWRMVLRLRLGPLDSPEHVLGWRIVRTEHGRVDLEAGSPFLTARKILLCSTDSVVVATFISYRTRYARPIWSAVSVVHHRTEPLLLTQASS